MTYLVDWEVVGELDRLSYYDQEVELRATFGCIEFSATGMLSCGMLVQIYKETIEVL